MAFWMVEIHKASSGGAQTKQQMPFRGETGLDVVRASKIVDTYKSLISIGYSSHSIDTSMCNGMNTVVTKTVYSPNSQFGTSAMESTDTTNTTGRFARCQSEFCITKAGKAIAADHTRAEGNARETCASTRGTWM